MKNYIVPGVRLIYLEISTYQETCEETSAFQKALDIFYFS
jgi:hypothetical protein